jgi:hypothetical protein
MITPAIETIACAFESFDARLSNVEQRFVALEGHLFDAAQATDEISKSLEKLSGLYLAIDDRLGNIEQLLSNYVSETQALRLTSRQLAAEFRERLKA